MRGSENEGGGEFDEEVEREVGRVGGKGDEVRENKGK